ncbi:MAG: lipopolysaccharide biosynthesis protein [Brevinema sp.]
MVLYKKTLMGSAFYSIGNMAGAGLNMLYQFILMLFLTGEEYGVIQPLLQFIGLLVLPSAAYQYALTKHYSKLDSQTICYESLIIFRRMIVLGIAISVMWILLIPTMKNFFHVEDSNIFVLLLISLLLQIIQTPFISRLQAEKEFFVAGMTQMGQGIVRMTLGLVILSLLPNIWGAILGVIISNISLIYGNMFLYIKSLFQKIPSNFQAKPISFKLLFVSLGSVGLFSLLIYSDTVLVRSILPEFSGVFASSNLLGKGMIFLTAGISFVILPFMAEQLHDIKKALWIGFFCLLTLILLYVGFFMIVGPFLGHFLFKNEPIILAGFDKYLTYYNIMFIPYPLIYYFLNYYLVKENIFYPILLALSNIILYIGIVCYGNTLDIIILIIGVVGYSTLCCVLIHSLYTQNDGNVHEEQIDESQIEKIN